MPPKKEGGDVDASPRGIAGRPARGASTSMGSQQHYVIEELDARPLRTSRRWSMNLAGFLVGAGPSIGSLGFPQTVCVYNSQLLGSDVAAVCGTYGNFESYAL